MAFHDPCHTLCSLSLHQAICSLVQHVIHGNARNIPSLLLFKSKSLGMDLEDVGTTFQIWQAELNLSVQTSEFRAALRRLHVHISAENFWS